MKKLGEVQVVHDDEQQKKKKKKKKNKQHSKTSNQETKLREYINSEREEQSVKSQQRDHSKRLRWHKTFNSSNDFSLSSKERWFRSNHTIHIKHPEPNSKCPNYVSQATDANKITNPPLILA